MIGEDAQYSDKLQDYYAIDPDVAVGRVPLAQCLELQSAVSSLELTPNAQLDYAWLGLETSMAMQHEVNPATGEAFAPKDVNIFTEQVRTNFRTVMRHEQALPVQRARAGLALASIGMQHEMIRNQRLRLSGQTHLFYLRGIQTTAKTLLAEGDRTAEEDDLLRTMTSLAVLTEYVLEVGWFLPAPPRQPWSINGYQRKSSKKARMVITDAGAQVAEGIMPLPLQVLGDDLWKGKDDLPHATLHQYLKAAPGFVQHETKTTARKRVFDIICDRHMGAMNAYDLAHATVETPADIDTQEPEPHESQRPEISWYIAQSSRDFRDLDPQRLHINMTNLEEAHARSELTPTQQQTLGWMQLEHARTIVVQAQEKRAEAAAARKREAQVSRFDASGFVAAAEAADQAAEAYIVEAKERFDVAGGTFAAAAAALPEEKMGDACCILLDAEAVPVYKALFTGASMAELTEIVGNYAWRLGGLYMPMRKAEEKLKRTRNGDQLDALQAAALQTSLCLLISGFHDEAERNIALPASPRSGGMQGEIHAVVFPIDWMNSRYHTDTPVNMKLTTGKAITHDRQYVSVGLDLLRRKDDSLGVLARLIASANALKATSRAPKNKNKQQKRVKSGSIDEIAYEVISAIADAI